MKREELSRHRSLMQKELHYDLVVVGGGLAGVCAAIAAARDGINTALIQDRPVLGGNASSEVRLWALGATSHMGNNNRWAREGGIVNEIMVENTYRNKEGNPIIFDTVIIDKVLKEPNIDLYLNTAVFSVIKSNDQHIEKVVAFNSQNSTLYDFVAKQFIDASGDGIVSYQAGVPFRIGAEGPEEFDEHVAPNIEDYGELLGHTLFFYSKKLDHAVNYTAPSYALEDVSQIPRIKNVKVGEDGCKLWWFEYGGRRDTIHDTEEIKLELWKVAYGIWNHIKNSGEYEGAENYTLEWVGLIPGKRESRRFEGHYMINQKDLVEQRHHEDAISFGGWAMDLHPADGIYSTKDGCTQWHTKGVYQIPYSCYVPKGIENLLLAGRIISATHVAFGSTRVMATCAHGGQAVGKAASYSLRNKVKPADILSGDHLNALQSELLAMGHYIPGFRLNSKYNLAESATIETSSTLNLTGLEHHGAWQELNYSMAQMIPVNGNIPDISIRVKSNKDTVLKAELRLSSKAVNHTPDVTIETFEFPLTKGENEITLSTSHRTTEPRYFFACLLKNEQASVAVSDTLVTGILSVFNSVNRAVSNFGKQLPPDGIGIDSFEFWCPKRRPNGKNMAFQLSSPVSLFEGENLINGIMRPVSQPNAWVAAMEDEEASFSLKWSETQRITTIRVFFDPDYDHPMETVQMQHPESEMPYCIRDFEIYNCGQTLLSSVKGNYQAMHEIVLDEPVETTSLVFKFKKGNKNAAIAVMGVICK